MKRFKIKFELHGFECTRTIRAKDRTEASQQALLIEKVLRAKGLKPSKVETEEVPS